MHEMTIQENDLLIRVHDIIIRAHDIIIRYHEIIIRLHDIIFRAHARDTNPFSRYNYLSAQLNNLRQLSGVFF